jgi:hypothetical protein
MRRNMSDPIPMEDALKICKDIQNKRKARLFSQCWGCLKFSKNDTTKMCFYDPPENRGCKFVNQYYDGSEIQ